MTHTTQEKIFGYVYVVLGVVFVVSLVMLAFGKGMAPFNTHFAWSGGSLVLTQYQAEPAEAGTSVARAGAREGEVTMYSVLETYRKDGELYYRTTPVNGSSEEVVVARTAPHVVLMAIPALGFWVRALGHPIGALALLGIPLLTFALDLLLAASASGAFRTARIATIRLMRRRKARRAAQARARAEAEAVLTQEDVYEEAYEEMATTPYTGPRTTPQNFGMTIHLSRPRRYSM